MDKGTENTDTTVVSNGEKIEKKACHDQVAVLLIRKNDKIIARHKLCR